jgi:hypothetical protein
MRRLTYIQLPRVVVHLDPSSFRLSPQCENFFTEHENDGDDDGKRREMLNSFTNRFGKLVALEHAADLHDSKEPSLSAESP